MSWQWCQTDDISPERSLKKDLFFSAACSRKVSVPCEELKAECKNIADTHNLCSHSVSVQSWCQEKCVIQGQHTLQLGPDLQVSPKRTVPVPYSTTRSNPSVSPDTYWGKTLALGFISLNAHIYSCTDFLSRQDKQSHTSRVFYLSHRNLKWVRWIITESCHFSSNKQAP